MDGRIRETAGYTGIHPSPTSVLMPQANVTTPAAYRQAGRKTDILTITPIMSADAAQPTGGCQGSYKHSNAVF